MLKNEELEQRMKKLQLEAIKKLKDEGTYQGPESDITNKKTMNPEKDKIKTEIKISAKKLKDYMKKNEALSNDLDLDSIFSCSEKKNEEGEAQVEETEVETDEIDSLLKELEGGEEEAKDDVDEVEIDEVKEGEGKDETSSHMESKTVKKVKAGLKNILEDLQTIKVNILAQDAADELSSIFNFKEESEGEEAGVKEDEEEISEAEKSLMETIDDVDRTITEDTELSEDELNNIKKKMNRLLNEIEAEAEKESSEDLSNLFADDGEPMQPSVENPAGEAEVEIDDHGDVDELLTNLFNDEGEAEGEDEMEDLSRLFSEDGDEDDEGVGGVDDEPEVEDISSLFSDDSGELESGDETDVINGFEVHDSDGASTPEELEDDLSDNLDNLFEEVEGESVEEDVDLDDNITI